MSRLPVPGSDDGSWGDILNDYLSQAHNSDGSLKAVPQTTVTNLVSDLAGKASDATVMHNNLLTAKGDVLAASGSATPTRLAIGVDGRVLTADSTQATGLAWSALPHLNAINVKDAPYNALGDGVADDTAALQSAINAGSVIMIPAGIYKITGTLVVASGKTLIGAGCSRTPQGGTIIRAASNFGDVFRLPAATVNAAIRSLTIQYMTVLPTDNVTSSTAAGIAFGTVALAAQEIYTILLEDLAIIGMGKAVFAPYADGTSAKIAQFYYLTIARCFIAACQVGLFLTGFSDSLIEDVLCQNVLGANCSLMQAKVAPINASALPSSTYGNTAQNLLNDLGNSVITKVEVYGGTGDGLVMQDCVASRLRACVGGGVNGNGLTVLGCGTQFQVSGMHAALNSGHGIYITSSSSNNTQECDFISCRTDDNNLHGIQVIPSGSTAISHLNFIACQSTGNSQVTAHTYNGIDITAQDISILGGSFSDFQGSPTQNVGINMLGAGSNYLNVIGTTVQGNQTAMNFAGNQLTVQGCHGINYSGFSTYTPGIPATGYGNRVGNGNMYKITIYLSGQTGTHIVDQNGTDYPLNVDPSVIVLQPHEAIYFATAAPTTWAWYGE